MRTSTDAQLRAIREATTEPGPFEVDELVMSVGGIELRLFVVGEGAAAWHIAGRMLWTPVHQA